MSRKTIFDPKADSPSRDREFPYDFQVSSKLGKTNIEMLSEITEQKKDKLTMESGRLLAKINSIKLPGYGFFSNKKANHGNLIGEHDSWLKYIFTNWRENLGFLVSNKIIMSDLSQQLATLLENNKSVIDTKHGYLLHGDFHNANILVDDNQTVVGAVDLTQSRVGDPLFDIAFYSTYYPKETVDQLIKGYSKIRSIETTDLQNKLSLYRIRINVSKAVLRKRFGYDYRIETAVGSVKQDLTLFHKT